MASPELPKGPIPRMDRQKLRRFLVENGRDRPGPKINIVEAAQGSNLLKRAREEVVNRYHESFARKGLSLEDVYNKLYVEDPYMDPERSKTLVALGDNSEFLGTIQLTFGEIENEGKVDKDGKPLRAIEAMTFMNPPIDSQLGVAEWPHRIGEDVYPDSQIAELGRLAIVRTVSNEDRAQILKKLADEAFKIAKEERSIRYVYAIMPSFVHDLFADAEIWGRFLNGAQLRKDEKRALEVYKDFPGYWERDRLPPELYRFSIGVSI